jgi:hypothetical protein
MSTKHKHLTELHNHLTSAIRIWNQYLAGRNPNCRQGEYMLAQAMVDQVEEVLKLDTGYTRMMRQLRAEHPAKEEV